MNKLRLLDLLADHADALNCLDNDGGFDSAAWLDQYGLMANGTYLLTLLQLAQAVKQALVPVKLSPSFQSELEAQLTQTKGEMVGKRPFSRGLWLGTAVAGVVGLLILIGHRLSASSRSTATAV